MVSSLVLVAWESTISRMRPKGTDQRQPAQNDDHGPSLPCHALAPLLAPL
jgi:hypothetical protein